MDADPGLDLSLSERFETAPKEFQALVQECEESRKWAEIYGVTLRDYHRNGLAREALWRWHRAEVAAAVQAALQAALEEGLDPSAVINIRTRLAGGSLAPCGQGVGGE